MCSGKIYYDLIEAREKNNNGEVVYSYRTALSFSCKNFS